MWKVPWLYNENVPITMDYLHISAYIYGYSQEILHGSSLRHAAEITGHIIHTS